MGIKHIVTLHLLVEVENESGLGEVEDMFTDQLIDAIAGLDGTFFAMVENSDYDPMAITDEPDEEQEAEGYFQADGNQEDEEVEESFEWAITDAEVYAIKEVPHAGQYTDYSVSGYLSLIEAKRA